MGHAQDIKYIRNVCKRFQQEAYDCTNQVHNIHIYSQTRLGKYKEIQDKYFEFDWDHQTHTKTGSFADPSFVLKKNIREASRSKSGLKKLRNEIEESRSKLMP